MNSSITEDGYVIIGPDQHVNKWTFHGYRKDCVREWCGEPGKKWHKTWKQWYAAGFRCIRATRTINFQKP